MHSRCRFVNAPVPHGLLAIQVVDSEICKSFDQQIIGTDCLILFKQMRGQFAK